MLFELMPHRLKSHIYTGAHIVLKDELLGTTYNNVQTEENKSEIMKCFYYLHENNINAFTHLYVQPFHFNYLRYTQALLLMRDIC